MSSFVIANVVESVKDAVGDVATGAAGAAANGIFGGFAAGINEALVSMVADIGTMWVKTPSPQISSSDPAVAFLHGHTVWYAGAALVMGILLAGARMAWEQNGQQLHTLLPGLLRLTIAAGGGVAILGLLVVAGDSGARWIIDDATGGDFAKEVGKLLSLTGAMGGMKPFLVIVLSFMALIVTIVQGMLMLARDSILTVIAGVLVYLVADSVTEKGKERYEKVLAWTIALLLYKPVAALMYAAAFVQLSSAGTADSPTIAFLKGMTLMVLAVLALPSLMRVVAPGVSAVAGSSSGAGAAAAVIPTGAAILARGSSSSKGGSPASNSSQAMPDGAPTAVQTATKSAEGSTSPGAGSDGGGGGGAGATDSGGGEPQTGAATKSGGGSAGTAAGASPAGAGLAAASAAHGAAKSGAEQAVGEGGSASSSGGTSSGPSGSGAPQPSGSSTAGGATPSNPSNPYISGAGAPAGETPGGASPAPRPSAAPEGPGGSAPGRSQHPGGSA